MKFLALAIAALASVAAAAPDGYDGSYDDGSDGHPIIPVRCTPPAYACLPNANGWQVCNTAGQFVFAGNCPPNTVCKFFAPSKSPYCVPPNFQIP